MRTYSTRKRILDWAPRVALDDGLTHAIAYFRGSERRGRVAKFEAK